MISVIRSPTQNLNTCVTVVLVSLAFLLCFGWFCEEARSSAEAGFSPQVLGVCLASGCRICLATASVPVEIRISGV